MMVRIDHERMSASDRILDIEERVLNRCASDGVIFANRLRVCTAN